MAVMVRRLARVLLLVACLVPGGSAHRLDEYLQATLLNVTRDAVEVELRLTPGVAVLPTVLLVIDRDLDGRISPEEEKAYGEWVARDLELRLDGRLRPLRLMESQFPSTGEMREGLGSIRLKLRAAGSGRQLRFENRHLSEVSAYLVNCQSAPGDGLVVGAQQRDEAQRSIRFAYSFNGNSGMPALWWWRWPVGIVVLLAALLVARSWRDRGAEC